MAVKITEALLDKYSNEELIDYITKEIKFALKGDIAGNVPDYELPTIRLMKVDRLYEILEAVNARMNKSTSRGASVVI